ncbi:MAG: 3,4-dihydroxy-2-butanone 4-phosphate synthase, partial [Pseudomonadota bacterium]
DGNMARLPDLIKFSEQHNIKIGTIADLIEYRRKNEKLIEKLIEKNILTPYGEMKLILYKDKILEETHIALVKGEIQKDKETIVRVHEPLSVIDLLDIEDKKHSWNALKAIKKISEDGGVLIFINHNTNTNDLLNILKTENTLPLKSSNDLRNYGIGSQILVDLGVRKMKLLSAPRKMPSMIGFGLEITGYLEN